MGGGLSPPPEVVLSWKPNYVNPELRSDALVVMEYVLLAVCYVIVALRVYMRVYLGKNFGIDDALIIFNLIPLTGLAVSIILAWKHFGWNRHVWDIPPDMMVKARKDELAIEMTYMYSTCITKISILLFYRRLGGSISPKFRRIVYAAIVFVLLYLVTWSILAFTQCQPLNAFWNRGNMFWLAEHTDDWYCIDEPTHLIAASVFSLLQDLIACLLPMALFARLKIHLRQKIALGAIFGVGFLYWTCIESHIAVVCASLPALKHFFRSWWKESDVTTGLKSWTSKYYDSNSRLKSKNNGYGQTTSQTGSEAAHELRTSKNDIKGIHVTRDVMLEESVFTKGQHRVKQESQVKIVAVRTKMMDEESLALGKGTTE